jgi:glycosidase
MTIGEIWEEDAMVVPWVVNQQVDLAFEFDLAFAMLASINDGNSAPILATLGSGTKQFPKGQYGTFLANHDMHRVMDQLGGNPEKSKAAASLYFSLPGVPFMYYGEELGMSEDGLLRVPMQWSGERYAGFSDVTPWETPDRDYPIFNVAAETGDPKSILSHYRNLISLRNSYPALRTGDLALLFTFNQGLFACLRTTADESVLVIVNLTNAPVSDYKLSLAASALPQGEYVPISLLDETALTPLTILDKGQISNYVPIVEIPPYGTIMIQLKSK